MNDSSGNCARTARSTDSPPSPESKMPMGATAVGVAGMTEGVDMNGLDAVTGSVERVYSGVPIIVCW
ncbi:hypothetical protein Bcon01_81400 [Burkholderia contaminans]|nr:hypothetical protein Bcon01_81400 [Burkholderia contaminans]